MSIQGKSSYHEVHARSLADPEGFWAEAAKEIDWIEPPKTIFDPSQGTYGRWFTGGVVNTCYNALDRHVEGGRADQVALIHDSPLAGSVTKLTYAELLHEVQALGAIMQDFGVAKGDRVILYMPMVPEAVVAMLACARIGAVHSVVFGGFAAKELATRIDDAQPKLILSASCGIEPGRIVQYKPLLDEAIKLAGSKPKACIVLQRPQLTCDMTAGRDYDWASLRRKAMNDGKKAPCAPVAATDPLYILYTSGTTGIPKGVVRDNGGHLVAVKWSMFNLYGVKPGEVWWCGSDIGWVVGHSYIVYGPLLHGATTIMYEGKPVGTPDAGAFWRVIAEHKAVAFFTAPTAFRAIRKDDPEGKFIRQYDLSKFRTLFLAGERADPPTVEWAEQQLKVPVIDHWWQTETGWCIAGNPVGLGMLPVKHGSPTVPMPGYQVDVVDEAAKPVGPNTMGSIVIKLPMPPGCLPTLWNQDERFREAYLSEFPGYYKTSDAGYKDEDGYVFVMGRTDDIINVAGHRLSTGGMEEILASHPDVAECAVLGVKDAIKGEVPCGFLVLKTGVKRAPAEIEKEIIALVRDKLGPVAAFKLAITVGRLPKTRSGKILRGTIKKIADGDSWTMPATIEDPKTLDEIGEALKGRV
ncbi:MULTISPECIES: propionyl-CoA synthetase [Bradyrhizobium]|uniref:propionyl-CoA synthetase n=1 Tax=Bradyrhizobium TaxID=374 RepID=UPI000BA1A2DD|nr:MULTISPECIES: propionyl-CoA synthetase [Bradyrhizobium]AWM09874.1 propionyl-CoA synthetase [Bradyrhizobium symbiodeficiens]QIP02923.1 propionyl-CoA synthetase [Bradyrhizobium symbiodeficiens]UPJ59388.1 propionyl-CoA synthetase [Bradyrhizobium sp. 192]